jgi:NADH-quinone oxidoreductase subunit A
VRYGMAYYLYALMFLAFTVDIMFLLPVSLIYNYEGSSVGDLRAFIGILIFVGILSLAIIYAWKKGVFKWERKIYNPR